MILPFTDAFDLALLTGLESINSAKYLRNFYLSVGG